MRTSDLASVRKHREQMLDSYVDAIRRVGGSPEMFLRNIDKMSVADMMDMLAQNGVRFTTTRKGYYTDATAQD